MRTKLMMISCFIIFLCINFFFEHSSAQINTKSRKIESDIKNTSMLDSVESKIVLIAPDLTPVTISRDTFGVPHINAETKTGVFYGQGFAAAQDRLFQMETYRRTAEGKLAEWYAGQIGSDRYARNRFYTQQERVQQFNSLPQGIRDVFVAYTAGVNAYIDSMDNNPTQYKPYEFAQPGFEMKRWSVYKSLAILQYLSRRFGEFGGEELDRLVELQNNGWTWFNEHRPINDPNAPTTLESNTMLTTQKYHYSGMAVDPEIVRTMRKEEQLRDSLLLSIGVPKKFGSFAVQITTTKSSTGNVMLLGCPQMGVTTPNVVNEVELYCSSPHFDAGGMAIAGVPMIIIGHNDYCSWTWTSGFSDNLDLYIDSTFDASYSTYWYNGQWQPFNVYIDTIFINGGNPEIFTHYRTVHGPTLVMNDLPNHHVFSLKMTFWNEETGTIEFMYNQMKAQSLAEYEAALMLNKLSFNVFYIDKDQNVRYWHAGKFQDRTDGVDPRLPHKGDGTEEWNGFIPFSDLPSATGLTQDCFVNWNNKPVSWWNNGDNVPWIPDDLIGIYDRVLQIKNYVYPINSFTYENLKSVPFNIQSHGTYQQAIEMSSTEIIDSNLVSPGQSGFRDINGNYSPHYLDQLPLYNNWEFKDQIFGDPLFVPVELVSFSGNCAEKDVTLNWITKTETNNKGFDIARSNNGMDFSVIGFVEGNGTTTEIHTYSYTDKNLNDGEYYYKLKQIDFDGSYEYSDVIEVSVNVPKEFSLEQNYPNPFNPITNISYSLPTESQVKLSIYNTLGELVETIVNKKQNAGKYEAVWNARNYSSGIYIYSLDAVGLNSSDHKKISKKMILMK